MKPIALSVLTLLIFCVSCNQTPASKPQNVPEPLRDDSKDISSISKSRQGNLVNEIYYDLVKDHSDLQNLEDQRAHFNRGRLDSLEAFEKYNSKSDNYYESAFQNLNTIQDTVLRQRLKVLLTSSQQRYAEKSSKFTSLIQKMNNEAISTNDYYHTLMIAASMPVIEKYQDDNLPAIKRVEAIANESEKLNLKTKQLAGKYQDKITSKK